ncbi:MAG: hypothetical protein KDA57_20825 [Planctomycetales bacterium]|nr:hypothetical protein [Planctomycetales bacterium]
MAKVIGICHFNLRAPRGLLEQLCDFYTAIVGLSVGARPSFNSFGFWLYAGPKDVLHLTEATPQENVGVHVSTTFNHVAFSCCDLASYRARLDAAGIAYKCDLVPGTGQVQLFLNDPAGNGVELNFSAGV